MSSQITTKSFSTTNRSPIMCRRSVTVCFTCRCRTMTLKTCRDWKSDTSRNIFGSGWMKTHVDRNRYNFINSLRIGICDTCMGTGVLVEQPGFDSMNRKAIGDLPAEIKKSLIGVTQLRVKFPGYVVFI